MVADIVQDHVTSAGSSKIHYSELFTKDVGVTQKDKELLNVVLGKCCADITTKEWTRLKDISRLHFPSSLRVKLWLLLTGGNHVLTTTPKLYDDTSQRLFSDGDCKTEDGNYERQMMTYCLSAEGIGKLQKILVVVKELHPDITYCPLLEPLAAIMLHFMDENQCYACLGGILEKRSSFLDQTKFDNARTDVAIQDLFKSVNKKAYARMQSFAMPDLDSSEDSSKIVLFPQWRNMIFERLDLIILVRVVDCLLVEGSKILFRVGLYLLNEFYSYSFSFSKFQFSDPQDLITTIGQHTESLDVTPEMFIKAALKIKFTSKQMLKINQDNSKLYKEKLLEYTQSDVFNNFTQQVIAVDLNKVSDIIKPLLWLQLCEWLPPRIQIKQPFLLFSTNKDGFNLRTLYMHCEEEEQTLIILHTSDEETFGAYLSAPLSERSNGHNNLSFFGTGETFIFRLAPRPVCYLWNKGVEFGRQQTNGQQNGQKNKYVFVDTLPLSLQGGGDRRYSRRRSSARKSIMRRLSRRLSRSNVRSVSTPNNDDLDQVEPLSAINSNLQNCATVPYNLNVAQVKQMGIQRHHSLPAKAHGLRASSETPIDIQGAMQKDLPDNASGIHQSHLPTNECFHVVNKDVQSPTGDHPTFLMGSQQSQLDVYSEEDDAFEEDAPLQPPASLFISCDKSTFVIGGGGGRGLYFDGDLQVGHSSRCDTYQNESLTSTDNGDFKITRLDVFGFN